MAYIFYDKIYWGFYLVIAVFFFLLIKGRKKIKIRWVFWLMIFCVASLFMIFLLMHLITISLRLRERRDVISSVKAIENDLEYFFRDHERYPNNIEGIKILYKDRKYIKSPGRLKCPYRNSWDYKATNNAKNYYLRSIGPDGLPGTDDDVNSKNHPWPNNKSRNGL